MKKLVKKVSKRVKLVTLYAQESCTIVNTLC